MVKASFRRRSSSSCVTLSADKTLRVRAGQDPRLQCSARFSVWPVQSETFPAAQEGGVPRSFMDLPLDERGKLLKDRLKKYCQKACRDIFLSQLSRMLRPHRELLSRPGRRYCRQGGQVFTP